MEPKPKIPSYKKLTRKERKELENSMWVDQRAWVSKKTGDIIAEIATMTQMPKSRVAAYFIDLGITFMKNPMNVLDIPEKPKDAPENEYAHEAKLIYDFLKRCSKPFGLDSIIMFRRDIGIESKERVVGGYYELLDAGMIVEQYPFNHSFNFHRDYKAAKIKGHR